MKDNRQAKARHASEMRHRINVGREAVREQLAFFERQFGQVVSEWKEDDTRVTFADFAISERISTVVRRSFPDDDFCSEEANPMDEVSTLESDFAWVVDPIDGTNNFALGFPVCAISLALLYQGTPVYGFLYDHSRGCLLEGGPGYGLLRDQKKVVSEPHASKSQYMVGLHFPMTETQLQQLGRVLSRYRVRAIGSGALAAAYVATGYLQASIDFKIKVWDIAAAYALCEAAGYTFEFLGESPFPMRTFHPRMDYCPYFVGEPGVRELLQL